MLTFTITFLMFAAVDFLSVWWYKSLNKNKPLQTALAAASIMFFTVTSMWLTFVSESIAGAIGMIMGAGIGAYAGCKYYGK